MDHLRVYWYNKQTRKLYSVNKNTGRDFIQQSIPDVQDIVAYGDHLQPLPGMSQFVNVCLREWIDDVGICILNGVVGWRVCVWMAMAMVGVGW